MLFFGHHTFVSDHILAVCRSHALYFVVTITEVLSSSTIIVSFVRLFVHLSFWLLFWNHETVDMYLYNIKNRLPTLTSEVNCHDAC